MHPRGVLIAEVARNSPAERAGIKAGDIVVAINGTTLESATQLRNAIGLLRVGQSVEFKLLHKGVTRTVTLLITGHREAASSRATRDAVRLAAREKIATGHSHGSLHGSPACSSVARNIVSKLESAPLALRSDVG